MISKEPSPCYIVDEKKLLKNLELIESVSRRADVEIVLALKAFANWKLFPIMRRCVSHTTASSLYEARLSADYFGGLTYSYSPAYENESFDELLKFSGHVTFNSLSQYLRFLPLVKRFNETAGKHRVSVGLRINPEYSEIETDLYNPCAIGSRFGVKRNQLGDKLPEGIEGLHFHCLCENDSSTLQNVLYRVESRFGCFLDQAKWLNLGGGHLVTRQGYDIELLVDCINRIHEHHPGLRIVMEPGSAFLWQTGYLRSTVVDIVKSDNISTAILNVSFTCHMPDCLEMPYWPNVRGAETLEKLMPDEASKISNVYRLGGNSCLSGDFMGFWKFDKPLNVGDDIVFEDMIHYTTVKTNMFNGINHPSIAVKHLDGNIEILKRFTYDDYRDRMD